MWKNIVFVFVLILSVLSCKDDSLNFQQELDNAINSAADPSAMAEALLLLEQKYPSRAEIKAQLGIIHLMKGDFLSAKIMLTSAESLINRKTGNDTKYLVYAGLADLHEKNGEISDSKKYAEAALSIPVNDTLGVLLHICRAETALGNKAQALEQYLVAIKEQSSFFTEADYSNLVGLLVVNNDIDIAIEYYLQKIESLGYSNGDGLTLSTLYEKNGDFSKSLVSASYELWRLLHEDVLTPKECINRLDEVAEKVLPVLDGKTKDEFSMIVDAQTRIFGFGWTDAVGVYIELDLFQGDWFEQFFFYLATLMSEDVPAHETMKRYVILEPAFRRSQLYYYYLWNILKKGEGKYTFSTVRGILDKVVLFGVNTQLSEKTKKEAGRLLGLSEKESQSLFPARYVESVLTGYLIVRDEKSLLPIKALLSLPNNPYTDDCMKILYQLRDDGLIRSSFLTDEEKMNNLYGQRVTDIFR